MEQENDLFSLLSVFRRHLGIIVAAVVIGLALAGLALFLLRPVYSTAAVVFVDPAEKNLLATDTALSNTVFDSARVDSEVEMMATDAVLIAAIKDLNLIADPEFGVRLSLTDQLLALTGVAQPALPTGDAALQSVLNRVREALTIQRRGNTYVVSVGAEAHDPATAAKLANAVSTAYISQQVANKVASTLASRDIVQSRVKEAGDAVVSSENAYDGFIFDNLQTIAKQSSDPNLLALRDQIEAIESQNATSSKLVAAVEQSLARNDLQAVVSNLQDEALSKLQRDREALVKQRDAQTDPVRTTGITAELQNLEAKLDEGARAGIATLRQSIETADQQAADARQKLRSEVLNSNLSASVLANLYQLQQSAENARTQYRLLLARSNDLDSQAYLQVADSRIVSAALAPIQPSFPKPLVLLGMAGIASLAIGLALAFAIERYVGGYTSEAQIEAVTRRRVVATVPKRGGSPFQAAPIDSLVSDSYSSYAESFRRLRVAIEQLTPSSKAGTPQGRVVAVTSSSPGEGKSTLAISLARSAAVAGRATLLIDCDFRKPSIHSYLKLKSSKLLSDYLSSPAGTSLPPDFVVADTNSEARVIVGSREGGLVLAEPTSIERLTTVIDAARSRFDLIIIDTPPIGPVADAAVLVPLADIVLFAVKWAATSQQDVAQAMQRIAEAKRPQAELVVVLNQQPARGSLGKKYKGYYG